MAADHSLSTMVKSLLAQARTLKTAGRIDEALTLNRRAAELHPLDGRVLHALAATLGDLSLFPEAESAAACAIAAGTDAAETWLVRARALQGMGRLDAAEEAFLAAIARRPLYRDAHRDLAQLRWMSTGSIERALAGVDAALQDAPHSAELVLLRAQLLGNAGRDAEGLGFLEAELIHEPRHPSLRMAAARAAARIGDGPRQLEHAGAALAAAPGSSEVAQATVEALLHVGRAGEAARLAERIVLATPGDQGALALLATAWRLIGDVRYATLGDPTLVGEDRITTPDGWQDLATFLDELGVALRRQHHWRSHPLGQSLRHGSQTQVDLTRVEDPAIRALFAVLDAPIRRHIAKLAKRGDPRARPDGAHRTGGAWSVLLPPGGFHTDHFHSRGWLSTAFYVDLPEAVGRGHEGWLAFGRPGIPTTPRLKPERFVRPEPGKLVLFPSYFWHGTEPFDGNENRLTVAFDILPG